MKENNRIARVTIIQNQQINQALDVLEEFGFSKEKCKHAIINNQPFFTFHEFHFYDFEFMEKLLSRLAYEDIPFRVETLEKSNWVQSSSYNHIQKHHYVRRRKTDKYEDYSKESLFAKLFTLFVTLCFGIWAAIMPCHFFISPEDLKNLNFEHVTYDWDSY